MAIPVALKAVGAGEVKVAITLAAREGTLAVREGTLAAREGTLGADLKMEGVVNKVAIPAVAPAVCVAPDTECYLLTNE